MSAEVELQAALVAALGAAAGLAGVAVVDGADPRQPLPFLVLGEGLSFDWSTKTEPGREHRVGLGLWHEPGRPAALHALLDAADAAVAGLPPHLPTNRIVSTLLVRRRLVRSADGPWAGLLEHRIRTTTSL